MPLSAKNLIEKIIIRLERLVDELKKDRHPEIHRRIDQFYYMEKIEEYRILLDDYAATFQKLKVLEERFTATYPCLFRQWNKDVRYLHARKKNNPRIIL